MATFYIDKDARNEFRYILKSANNETILRDSEGHSTKQACLVSIDSVKRNAPNVDRYTRWETAGQYWFNLKAANGETIGVSEGYATAAGRDNGIAAVRRDAPSANTVDRT